MKKTIPILLIILTNLAFSQKVKDHRISFDYVRLPLKPLDKQIQSYQSKIISWEEEAAVEMQKRYELELATYRDNYKIAQDQYKKELAEYNRKTRLEKVIDKELLEQNKPVFIPPTYPDFADIPKSPDNENMETKYLSLDGYEKGIDTPGFITVELKEFEKGETTKKTKTTGTGESQKTTTTYYTKYKQPVKLTIESVVKGVLFDDMLEVSLKNYTYSSKIKPTYEQVKKFGVNDLMSYTSKYVNSRYGRTKRNHSTTVILVQKYKKYTYSEYEEAVVHAASGYKNILLDKNKSISSFNKAINIWEKALEGYDPNNKKSRINREVAWYTMLNIAEAYLWTENFDMADEYLSRMEVVVDKWSTKDRFKDTKDRVQNHKERFIANQR